MIGWNRWVSLKRDFATTDGVSVAGGTTPEGFSPFKCMRDFISLYMGMFRKVEFFIGNRGYFCLTSSKPCL